MKSLKKNFLYNIIYQILILILPLITIPYVSRILGTNGIGLYSYTYSIIYYFIIFSMLGLNNYGNRTIAKIRDDREKLSKTFKEIHLMQIITTLIMLIFYGFFIIIYDHQYMIVFLVQSLYLISCFFDINWFFFGIEEFKLTVIRNIIIKFLSMICIFLFVKNSNDIIIYILILSGNSLLSQLVIWPFISNFVDKNVKIKFKDVIKHFIPNLKLFLPVIAVAIYKVMDKTMIGFLSSINEVGLYENAEKIINVPITIISALGTVMLPRMSNLYANNKNEESKDLINKSMSVIMFVAIPIMFGIISVSKPFSLLFFGNGFSKSGELMTLLSVTIVFLAWGNVIRTQYLIPKEMDKEFIISAFLGAIINFIMNIMLIPIYGSIGACYGTIAAEFIVVFYQTYKVKKFLPIMNYMKESSSYLVKSLIMFSIIIMVNYAAITDLSKLIIQIVIGSLVYSVLNFNFLKKIISSRGKYE